MRLDAPLDSGMKKQASENAYVAARQFKKQTKNKQGSVSSRGHKTGMFDYFGCSLFKNKY